MLCCMFIVRSFLIIVIIIVKNALSGTMIKFLLPDILGVSYRIPLKNQNAIYRLQISALVPEIFKFETWLK